MNLRIFGIVIFVVFFAVFSIYYIISSHHWNTILTDAKTNLGSASVYINTEATFYINSSITLVSNNKFSKILKTDYTNTEEKLSAYTKISGFFNILSVPSANPETLFTIYTANTSLLPCKYVKTMDEIPINDADTLIYRIKFSDIIWNTENQNSFVFYRNLNDAYLKYTRIKSSAENEVYAYCPLDRNFTEDFLNTLTKLVQTGVEFIMFEDDYTISGGKCSMLPAAATGI